MSRRLEFVYYVSVAVGLAIANASFTMISGLGNLTAGLWMSLAIALSGACCAAVAVCVGHLGRMYPASSGLRTYLKKGLGNRVSLVLMYLYVFFVVLVAGIENYMFALVLRSMWGDIPTLYVIAGVFALVLTTNLLGLDLPRSLQMVSTGVLYVGLVGLGLVGLFSEGSAAHLLAATRESTDLGLLAMLPAATGMGFFLFVGFEWVTPLALRRESFERLIPRSMVVAVLMNTAMNALFVAALAGVLSREEITASPIVQVGLAVKLLGRTGHLIAVVLSALAIVSTFNAGLMGGSRLLYTMAREGCFFAFCGRVSLRSGVTWGAVLFLGLLAAVSSFVVISFDLQFAAAVVGSAIVCFVYGGVILSLIRLQKAKPGRLVRGLQWAGVALLPLLGAFSLISEPTLGIKPIVGLAILAVVAVLLMRRFTPGDAAARPRSAEA
jgi:ethanolamine permease